MADDPHSAAEIIARLERLGREAHDDRVRLRGVIEEMPAIAASARASTVRDGALMHAAAMAATAAVAVGVGLCGGG